VFHGCEELGDDKAVGRVLEMLAEGPPAEVPNLDELAVRAVEAWGVRGEEVGGSGV
jgi:hypothetical protein